MNTLLNAWQLAGWTMVLFLAAGTAMLIIAGAMRLLLRRANANVRYGASLMSFVLLTALPVIIAGTLAASRVVPTPTEIATTENTKNTKVLNVEVAMASPERQRRELTTLELATEVTESTEKIGNNSSLVATVDPLIVFQDLSNQSIGYLPWVWIVGTPLTFLLLASGLIGAERLRRSCKLLSDGPIHAACEELRTALKITRKVGVAICDSIASPLVVGVVKPLILLPPSALTGWSPEHLEMVLVHELAHVRRWDNAVNLSQRVVESLLFFHPAVWIVSGWVRRDREDCCDAVVVRHTAKPQAYAELLLALASHQPLAVSAAMAKHPVASRIRRILKLQDEPMLVSRQALAFLASAVLACVLAAGFFAPSEAEESVSREASRSEAERVEETTNQTNATNEDLATEDTESTEENKHPLFPTLEDQRAADLAYKLLGVELEKLTPEELERVKAKGYQGGLRVASVSGGQMINGDLAVGDILVGLHVWPTESLKQLQEILSREDLNQLSPLKYYALRHAFLDPSSESTYVVPAPPQSPGLVVTGRIQVDVDAWRAMAEISQNTSTDGEETHNPLTLRQAAAKYRFARNNYVGQLANKRNWPDSVAQSEIDELKLAADKAMLEWAKLAAKEEFEKADESQQSNVALTTPVSDSPLYDGKTFDEWRQMWKTELKTEKRTECIKALAAFGRAGMGSEAAEAILDVAGEYDFSSENPTYIEDNAITKLKESIREVLTNYGNHLSERDWLPALQERLNNDPAKYQGFASQVLWRLVTSDENVKPILSKLQKSKHQSVRQGALHAIFVSQEVYTDDEKDSLIRATLAKEPVAAIKVLNQRLLNYVPIELAVGYLVSEDADLQLAARNAIHRFLDKEKGLLLTQELLEILSDNNRSQDHLAAVRALAALRYQANAAWLPLTKLIESTEDEELMLAAAFAKEMVTLEQGHMRGSVSPETKTAVRVSKRWPQFERDEQKLIQALRAEEARVSGEQSTMGFGGGGMMGGGGAF